MLQKNLKCAGNGGFSLVEVMISVGILSVLIGVTTVFIQRSNDQLLLKTAKIEQTRLSRAIRADLQKVSSVRNSASLATGGNELQFKRCMESNNANTPDCITTDANNQRAISYFGKNGGVANARKSGTATSPVRYSLYGVLNCNLSTPFCPFWTVETFFWATCPGGAATCDQASNIHVRYIVKPSRATYRGLPLGSLPALADFNANKTKYSISHNVQSGRNAIGENQDCPTGAIMAGLDANGRISCICKGGFNNTEVNPARPPICVALATACQPGQRIKGRKADGSVLCVNQRPICRTVNFASSDGDARSSDQSATCPIGGWIEDINLGYCRPGRRNKKGTTRGIACDLNVGRCCYYEEY